MSHQADNRVPAACVVALWVLTVWLWGAPGWPQDAAPDAVIILDGAGNAEVRVQVQVGGVAGGPARGDRATAEPPVSTHAVFFNEEREMGARLRKADELRKAGKLQQAFDLYQYVMENAGADVLFRVDDNRFAGAREYCIRGIMQLPEALLRRYRLTVDGDVARLFEEVRERAAPGRTEDLGVRCYVSSHGPAILDYAGDLYAGRGEWERAASCWRRLMRWGPSTDMARELIETKLVLALARSGQLRAARKVLDTLSARDPDTQTTLGGERRKTVPYLTAVLARHVGGVPGKVGRGRGDWPQFGGSASHATVTHAEFRCDVKTGEFLIPGYDWKLPGVPPHPSGPFGSTGVADASGAGLLGYAPFHPVYGSGRIFIHDDRGVMAFRVGAISPEWVVGEMGEATAVRGGRVVVNGIVTVRSGGRAWACAYENGVVYASLHDAPNGRELWALTEKGTMLWRITRVRVGFEWLADTSEISDPVVFDGKLYFCAWQTDQYGRSCSLVCVDAADGELNWQRFICSGPAARYFVRGQRPAMSVLVLPAASDGLVVVSSNSGGIAAVDARTGELRWGFAYEQVATQWQHFVPRTGKGPGHTRGSNATPLVHQGVVYVAPVDSTRVYALELDTGTCLWRAPRGEHDRIVGLVDGRLIVSGSRAAALDVTSGKTVWACDAEEAGYAGQGFITNGAVYIPGTQAIYRLDPATGAVLGRLLVERDAGEYGNLLLVEDTVVQVGRRASYYGEWDRVHARLAQEVALHPENPFGHIELAVIHARKEDRRSAMRCFERALELTADARDEPTGRLRREIHRRLYTIYAAEVKKVRDEGRTRAALTLALRCRTYATTDERRIEGIMRVLEIHETRRDWANVVRELQSCIERGPRVAYAFDGTSAMQPALYARLRIADLIAEHGRDVYATFERQAGGLYEKGLKTDLETLVRVYPNSTYALRSLSRLGRIEASAGRFRRAADHLSQYLRLAPRDAEGVVQVKWRLAHYHERAGHYGAARRVLLKLAATHGDVRLGEEYGRRPLAEVVTAKLDEEAYRRALTHRGAGAFEVPLSEKARTTSSGTPLQNFQDDAMVLVDYAAKQILRVDGDTGGVMWRVGTEQQHMMGGQRLDERLLVWSRAYVKMLDATTGKVAWTWQADAPQEGDPKVRRRITNAIVGACLDDGRVAVNVGGARRELVLLDAEAGGKTLWKRRLPTSPVWAPVMWQDRVAVVTIQGMVIYERQTGEQVVKVSSQRPRRMPMVLDDGRILIPGFTKLECVDLGAGKLLWSTPLQLYHVAQHMFDGLARLGAKDYAVLCTMDRRVVCIDLETGRTVWSRKTPDARRRPMGMRVQDDAVYVVMANFTNEGRRARVLKLDLKTGTEQWTTAAMEGAHPIDLRLGKGAMAVLANMYKVKKVGQRVQHHMADPTLFCIDKETGRIVQRVVLKRTDRPVGRNFARRIIPADETLWVVYNDRLVGYRGPD